MTKSLTIRYKAARSIRIACGLVFILFCSFYLFFQTHLLEMLQKVLSDGQTAVALYRDKDPVTGNYPFALCSRNQLEKGEIF